MVQVKRHRSYSPIGFLCQAFFFPKESGAERYITKLKTTAIIHIAIMDLFLRAAIKDNPAIAGVPVIIGGENGEIKKGAIIAVSPEAMALGLRPGKSMRKAMKAAPAVAAFLPRYEAACAISDKFFLILKQTTSLMESFGPDEAFLSITQRGTAPGGDERVYVLADKLAAEVQGRLKSELGLHTLIGIAPNKPLARLAGLSAKKDGIVTVTKNSAPAFIKGLPIRRLPSMDKDGERLLKALGMATVEELSKTPLLFFEKNFGKSRGKIIFESARARGPVEVRPFFEPDGISDEVTFDNGPQGSSLIKETLYMLTESLTLRLKEAKRLCRAISIKITFTDFACVVNTLKLTEETDSFSSTWNAVLRLLEDRPIKGDILLVGLKLHS